MSQQLHWCRQVPTTGTVPFQMSTASAGPLALEKPGMDRSGLLQLNPWATFSEVSEKMLYQYNKGQATGGGKNSCIGLI